MTLRELQKRINDTVAQNDARSEEWSRRNDMPVLIEIRRDTKRYLRRFLPAQRMQATMYTIGESRFGSVISADEREAISVTRMQEVA
jgi:hypothetical protein